METKTADKILGYVLLAAGLILIAYAIYSMFNVFAGKTTPPSVFHMKSVAMPMPAGEGIPLKEIEILPGAEISKVVDMLLWFMLMTFVSSSGGRIAGLGIKLKRDIKVEVKGE